MPTSPPCAECGRPTDDHDRHVRFRVPDPVLAAGEAPAEDLWTTDPDPLRAVLLQRQGVGAFVRCLLPVELSGGYTVTFGVWVAVHPHDLQRAFRAWHAESYPELVLEGRLANALPVWGLLAAPVRAGVRVVDETPYVMSSSDDVLQEVLTRRWSHEQVLAALPT